MIGASLASCCLGAVMPIPHRQATRVQAENQKLREQLLRVQKSVQDLQVRTHLLQTGDGREIEARRNGWLAPGEVRLILVPSTTLR